MTCHRCGNEINDAEISSATISIAGKIQRTIICKDCAELLLEEMTPALIPGYSVSRMDIIRQKLKTMKDQKPADALADEIRELKNSGLTVPEIAQSLNLSNRVVMDFINRG